MLSDMKPWLLFSCAALMLLASPFLGIWFTGKPLSPYLEFPPRPVPIAAPEFSWPAFALMLAFIAGAIAPFVWRFLSAPPTGNVSMQGRRPLPGWGWAALVLLGASWALAWTRITWFEPLQAHTFTPLWLSYIGVVNALTVRRKGSSIFTREPARFGLLFPDRKS